LEIVNRDLHTVSEIIINVRTPSSKEKGNHDAKSNFAEGKNATKKSNFDSVKLAQRKFIGP